EPATVLVGPFEVDETASIERPLPYRTQLRMCGEDRAVRRSGVEPDIEDVGFLPERALGVATRTAQTKRREVRYRPLEPHVRSVASRERGGALHDARIQPALRAGFAVERGDPDAPRALARQAPIGAQPHRVTDAVARRWRLPAHVPVDDLERPIAMP